MAQSGFTPIQLYFSTTAAATPSAGNLANGELAVNITDGKLFYKDNGGVVRVLATAAGSAGDVVGPGSSTDNALVRFDGTTGKLVQSSVGVLSDAGALSGLTSVAATTFTGALTGNASTATTLQTSRTIWGQSFDGSANVTGALTGVTDLTASGSLTLNGGTANGVAYLNGSKVLTSGSALTFDGANLGVGTASPSYGVDVRGASGVGIQIFETSTGNNNRLILTQQATVSTYNSTFSTGSGAHAWQLGGSEQMRLTSTGLGIGTSSPGAKLHVLGSDGATTSITAGATGRLRTFGYVDATRGALLDSINTAENTYLPLTLNGSSLLLQTGATTKTTLDSSGNLGLGVTPSAWSQGRAMEFINPGYGLWNGSGSPASMYMLANAYFNSGFKYGGTGQASHYYQYQGAHVWSTAPSGTAGNAISFTQAMTLDASGNLVVGNTSPSGMRLGVTGYSPELYDPTTFSSKFAYLPKGSQELFEINLGATAKAGYANLINVSIGDNNGADQVYFGAVAQSNGNAGANFVFGRRTGAQTWAESARIDSSGNLLVGTTVSTVPVEQSFQFIKSAGAVRVNHSTANPTGDQFIGFFYNGSGIGSISQSGTTAVLYNVTSDQRLKENIVDAPEFGSVIDSIQVRSYDWITDKTHQRAGFIAQELVNVAPEAVHQPTNPDDMMAVDYSKLVPMLVKEIQSLRQRLAAAGI